MRGFFVPVLALVAALPLSLGGCSDQLLLGSRADDEPLPDDDDAADDDDATPADDDDATPPDDDDATPEPPDCADSVDASTWQWWGSPPFETEPDPTDDQDRPFHDPAFAARGWSTVALPDSGHSPPGTDRVYRAEFELSQDQAGLALFLWMQADDGMAFWLNGTLLGRWGGGWQEEGCVNDDAGCLESETVDPVDLSALLQPGANVAAARVSNPVKNAFFDVYVECVEAER